MTCPKNKARPIRHPAQVPDRNGKIFYTSITSLSHISKIAAIILDETFDNFKKYIQRSPSDNDGRILNSIIADTNQDFLEFCSTLRNNLHYREQRSLCLGTPEQLYQALNTELSVIETLLERIRLELNIFPSKAKLRFYRFLRWVQMPNN